MQVKAVLLILDQKLLYLVLFSFLGVVFNNSFQRLNYFIKTMRWPGIEPGSTAWKAALLTIIPPTPDDQMKIYLKSNDIIAGHGRVLTFYFFIVWLYLFKQI